MGKLSWSKPDPATSAAPVDSSAPAAPVADTGDQNTEKQAVTLLGKLYEAIKKNKSTTAILTILGSLFVLYSSNPDLFKNMMSNPMSLLPAFMSKGEPSAAFGRRSRARKTRKRVRRRKSTRRRKSPKSPKRKSNSRSGRRKSRPRKLKKE